MDWQEKLDWLGLAAQGDVACNTCSANPRAVLVTHHATRPLTSTFREQGEPYSALPGQRVQSSSSSPDPRLGERGNVGVGARDLSPWLTHVVRSDGKRLPVVKTLMTSACEKDCFYCPTRRGRNSLRRLTFKPEELAYGFSEIHRKGAAQGIFLSSGIIGGGTRTMEKTIAAVELVRGRYEFTGYVHLKLMPGAERAAIERALNLADRVSVNLEAPNSERLAHLSSTKRFTEELLEPLRIARELIDANPEYRGKSMTTQFVVGAAGESDAEILSTASRLYGDLSLARVYYSAFSPVPDTPLENHAPTPAIREFRLYQSDFLLRRYGFTFDDLVFDEQGNLPTRVDPKLLWALNHPERFPLELNRANREELLRVPGIGPQTARRILQLRRSHKLTGLEELRRLGGDGTRAAPFVMLNGARPLRQLPLF